MKSLVHAADIGNPARPFEICKLWSMKVLSEFFAQVFNTIILLKVYL
jgi:hypothetical protein